MDQWFAQFNEAVSNPWVVLGFLGQALFFSRWVIQWYASEKRKESYVPLAFWYVSLAGALMIMVYALEQADPVFMLGQTVGILSYSRNIWLIRQKGKQQCQ